MNHLFKIRQQGVGPLVKKWSISWITHRRLCCIMWRHDVMHWRHMTSWCDSMTSCDVMISRQRPTLDICSRKSEMTFENDVFWPHDLDLWPTTLTSILVRDIINVNPCTKFRDHMSNGSAVRTLTNRHTHTHTDTHTHTHKRLRFYNLDRWRWR